MEEERWKIHVDMEGKKQYNATVSYSNIDGIWPCLGL